MNRISLFAISLFLLPASSALAEVCAVFDDLAVFERLDVTTEPGKGIIWSKLSARPDFYCLNILGDNLGDRAPTHAVILMPDEPLLRTRRGFRPTSLEPPPQQGLANPVVVWPRFDGRDWELLYSMWDYDSDGWADAHFVERTDNDANDVAPSVSVVGDKLHLIWTREGTTIQTMRSIGTLMQVGLAAEIEWSTPEVLVEAPALTPSTSVLEVPTGASAGYL